MLLARVFVPFAIAYFLAYIFRGVNAVIFPFLERDIGLTAADLGLLTSAFWLFFALIQPLLGVALDRFGPRRTQVALLLVGAFGSALFGLCHSFGQLIVARILIGLGFAAGLPGAVKAVALWFPRRQWGVITGFHMMVGGAGSMAATLPIEWSLSLISWQGLFFWLAGFTLFTALLHQVAVPEHTSTAQVPSLGQLFKVTGIVLTHPFYWRVQPLLAVQQTAFIGSISLWIGPWLRDAGGITDSAARADIQLWATAMTAVGFALSGLVTSGFRRLGVSDFTSCAVTSTLFALNCGWIAFGATGHPMISWMLFGLLGALPIQYMPMLVASFPHEYAGRVSTSSNLFVFLVIFAGQWALGKVVDLWPRTATGYAPDGYTWSFAALFILQLAGLAWMALSRARPMPHEEPAAAD
jgi:MFS family permease